MALTDFLIVFGVLGILGLVFWSKVMQQSMLDTLREIREFMKEMGDVEDKEL